METEEDLTILSKSELVEAYRRVKESRDKVFSVVSHDLRSPFSGLLGLSEMLVSDAARMTAEELQEYLSAMNDSLKNTYALLENLFEWGQIEREKYVRTLEQIPLQIIIDELLELLEVQRSEKDVTVLRLFDRDQLIETNSRMVEFVLKNFISNAIKFSESGSRLEIGCSDDGKEVYVRDFGVGIKSENIEKLFSMTASWRSQGTNGEGGTGLGLLAANRYAESFGGKIRVESAPGEGSTFTLILQEDPV
ncbi:MAG: HAMP domain-containing sensor histidine kinase [Spirochaetales bacterium]|uniref:histidine kinase n=1 Tax=Candidatus Thalassospirochaeta sargassi TaxID=3119039 RepID=A0AAJ1II37_9SPIO|nr:HAMP domain-containing sensor histidine kinase [Spirochaetales bacterium]